MSQDLPKNFHPFVLESTPGGKRTYDIYSRLLLDRIIFLGPIDDQVANVVIAQMLFLVREDKKEDITFYINSPGGDAICGLAIYDTMQFVPCDVATFCMGTTGGISTFLLSSGTRGKRYALPRSRIHMHAAEGVAQGSASDIEAQARELASVNEGLCDKLAKNTGQDPERIRRDLDPGISMSSQQAKEYGLIDDIVTTLISSPPT